MKRLAAEKVQESLPSMSWIYISLDIKLETAARNGGEWSTLLLVCCAFCKRIIIEEPSLLGCDSVTVQEVCNITKYHGAFKTWNYSPTDTTSHPTKSLSAAKLLLRTSYIKPIIIIIIIIDVCCYRPFLPGTSLEPEVIPTAQASSFTLQYFPYYV